jgi:hypothetical protein
MAKSKAQQALEFVRQTAEAGGSAIDVHNAFFGNGGKFHELFPSRVQREDFLKTVEYQEICRIRIALRQAQKASVS